MTEKISIGERVRGVREELKLSQQEMADRLGIALRSWQRIERGEGVPSGETLLKFEQVGYNAGWVLTGLGPRLRPTDQALDAPLPSGGPMGLLEKLMASMGKDAPKTPSRMIDPALMEKLAKLASSVYREAGMKLPGERATVEAATLYNELIARVADMSDQDEIEATLPQLRHQLKKRLAEAAAQPGSGKRSA